MSGPRDPTGPASPLQPPTPSIPVAHEMAGFASALADRYAIEREVGRGGMATVYLARDVRHDRRVALKVLNPELGAVLGAERFLAEIRVTANLQHPNLLPLFDSGEAAGLLFYVMPFVEGESLRHRLDREKQLPVDEAIKIAAAVASALDYAHAHGVIHRDLKPENILLQHGQPVVADFGIALAVSNAGGQRITQTGLSLGTPAYMSPEQATGDRVIDGRTDIYSLGAVCYEMLTGEPPHAGATAQAVIAKLMTEEPRPLTVLRRTVPVHIDAAVLRALQKLPADRFATARAFAEALEGTVVVALTSSSRTVSRSQSGWRAQLRNPVVLTLGALALAAVSLTVRQWSVVPEQRSDVVVRFPLAFPTNFIISLGDPRPIAISPDGRRLAFVARSAGGSQLYVRDFDDLQLRPLGGAGEPDNPVFSPDGEWIVFEEDGKLNKVSVDGNTVIPLGDFGIRDGMAWSPSGVIVVSLSGSLFTIPAGGGVTQRLTRPDSAGGELSQQWPVATPDGEHVLYMSRRSGEADASRIAVASLSSGETTVLDLVGTAPVGLIDETLVYVTANGALMAVPFDIKRRRVLGDPTPVGTNLFVHSLGAAAVALSSTGTLVFASGLQASRLTLVDARGEARPLFPDALGFGFPRYSPDGKRVAIAITSGGRTDVSIYDIESGTLSKLTSEGIVNERPEWTPDGKRVLFRTVRDGRSALWWQPTDRSAPAEPLLASAHLDFFEGVITPDGQHLVYQIDTAVSDVMYRALRADTTPRPIAVTRFAEAQARVSPDGKWVAFMTQASGGQQVVVQPFPGPGGQVQISTADGREPVWSRDGRRIYYRDERNIIAADVVTSPSFAVTSRTVLFEDSYMPSTAPHANFDVAPDGKSLLFLKAVGGSEIVVVHNWRAELRARLATTRRR